MQPLFLLATRVLALVVALKTLIEADTPKVLLFTNDVTPGPNVVLGDLVEPTGDWYTQQTAALSQAYIDISGNYHLSLLSNEWDYTGTDPGETVVGFALVGAGGDLYALAQLPAPVVLSNTSQSCITPVADLLFPPVRGA